MHAAPEDPVKLLVVDDEIGYCDKLSRCLSDRGYDVVATTDGREAVLLGGIHRPAVVITDWMLRDDIHGLHVLDAIRAVHPQTRAVVMTGFASADLRLEAKVREVSAFVEKPFTPDRIASAVGRALAGRAPEPTYPSFAFLHSDIDGRIVHMNDAAAALLSTRGARRAVSVRELFGSTPPFDPDRATTRWLEGLRPSARPERTCIARARRLPDGGHFVLLGDPKEATLLEYHMAAGLLLEARDPMPSTWRASGHGLVIDPETTDRTLVTCMFEELSSICHAAETFSRGLEILALDEEIRYVVVNPTALGDLAQFVARARELRPDLVLIGHAAPGGLHAVAAAGIERRIAKPWNVGDFVALLVGSS